MCGIALLYGPLGAELAARMENALGIMSHRGPDGEGLFLDSEIAIGHRRLSIVDLGASKQPMTDPSGRFVLTFNGEIYNYQELRTHLAPQWNFRTNGDTEVLLAGLVLQGKEFLVRAEGMWAFALWDAQERSILAGRDRMGKKPLYYQLLPSGFACASELPSLRALGSTPWHEDEDSTADYLRYGFFLPGYTAYREVREVLPGHYLQWKNSCGTTTQRPYWQLPAQHFAGTQHDAICLLRESFTEAVRRRMVADVEVGSFLSGGVDSSLIVGIATRCLGKRLKTFTIGFNNPAFDEQMYAQRAAQHFGTDHYAETLVEFLSSDLDSLLLKHMGQPFQDPSLLATALVSRVAAHHVKVALSGDGGDELFSGYQRYQARAILRWYTRLPIALRRSAQGFLRAIPESGTHHSRSLLKKAHLFCDTADRIDEETPYVAPLMFRRADRLRLAPDLADLGHTPPCLPTTVEPDDIARMMLADALVYLPQDIMTKVDRASMAASLEARSPFLDRAVVELALSIPRTWHRHGFSGKRMLRAAFADILPEWVWRRRKQGFAVPVYQWFKQSLGDKLLQMLNDLPGIPLRSDFVALLLSEHKAGIRDHGYRLWLIHAYLVWRRQVIASTN